MPVYYTKISLGQMHVFWLFINLFYFAKSTLIICEARLRAEAAFDTVESLVLASVYINMWYTDRPALTEKLQEVNCGGAGY